MANVPITPASFVPSPAPGRSGINGWIAASAIVAGAALWQREGQSSVELPIVAVLIAIAYAFRVRLATRGLRMLVRAILFTLVVVLYRMHPGKEQGTFVDSYLLDQMAEVCLAEIAVRCWSPPMRVGLPAVLPVMLTGFVVVVAMNSYDDTVGRYFAFPIVLLLLPGLQAYRPARSTRRRSQARIVVAAVLALLLGFILYTVTTLYRDPITNWSNRVILQAHIPVHTVGLSDQNRLTSMFGQEDAYDRVARIVSRSDAFGHFRAGAMGIYAHGVWGPPFRETDRKYIAIEPSVLTSSLTGEPAEVTMYMGIGGSILAPLNTASIGVDDSIILKWSSEDGGPVHARPEPDQYNLRIAREDAQGPLCIPPTPAYRRELLIVPGEINPGVKSLAMSITRGCSTPEEKMHAIEEYLPQHHHYSMYVHADDRDPVGDFILSTKSAHCEFFASAAVMLMRCAGIPARYVIGYYAHETEDGATVVRERDAHAWAECWINGKGWLTVDATPPAGLPEHMHSLPPLWTRAYEKVQDMLAAAKSTITPRRIAKVVAGCTGLILLLVLLQTRFHFRLRRRGPDLLHVYSSSGVDLEQLNRKFEAQCARRGYVCPAGVPWCEYLGRLSPELDAAVGTGSRLLVDREELMRFAERYSRVRFSANRTAGEMKQLNEMLRTIEQRPIKKIKEERP